MQIPFLWAEREMTTKLFNLQTWEKTIISSLKESALPCIKQKQNKYHTEIVFDVP